MPAADPLCIIYINLTVKRDKSTTRHPPPPRVTDTAVLRRSRDVNAGCECQSTFAAADHQTILPRKVVFRTKICCVIVGECMVFESIVDSDCCCCCCCCCCSLINSSPRAVRGHRTGSNNSGVEDYPSRKKNKQESIYTLTDTNRMPQTKIKQK